MFGITRTKGELHYTRSESEYLFSCHAASGPPETMKMANLAVP